MTLLVQDRPTIWWNARAAGDLTINRGGIGQPLQRANGEVVLAPLYDLVATRAREELSPRCAPNCAKLCAASDAT